jgi:hypothetical protein
MSSFLRVFWRLPIPVSPLAGSIADVFFSAVPKKKNIYFITV